MGSSRGRSKTRLASKKSSTQPPSSSFNLQHTNLSTQAARDVLRKPLSPPISRLRRAQQALIGKRRRVKNRNNKVRVSFQRSSTSSGLRSSRTRSSIHAPSRPKRPGVRLHPTQWLPLGTPRRRDAGPLPPLERRFGQVEVAKADVKGDTDSKLAYEVMRPTEEGVEPSYPLKQVAEEAEFKCKLAISRVSYAQQSELFAVPTPPKNGKNHARFVSLDEDHVENIKIPTNQSKRYGSYIVRAPPTSNRVGSQSNNGALSGVLLQRENKSKIVPQDSILDPSVENSLHRNLSQQNRLSCIVTPGKDKSRQVSATPPSDNRQRRTLSRFTKELERYCVAASTNGRAPLPPSTPTVSESPTTLDTVTELLPYHKQFKVAGLAVTSREQMPQISESVHPQLPERHIGRVKGINVSAVQIDGSSVTPSEQASAAPEQAARVVSDKQKTGSSVTRPTTQATQPQPTPISKPLLPWLLKQNPPLASTVHSGRKLSKEIIHPSPATIAEPLLTPSGVIDSYFDSLHPSALQDDLPTGRSSSSSAVSGTVSHANKPLPKQPPVTHHPIPTRSERRHMENTATWPTAGVLIHDHSPPPLSRGKLPGDLPAPVNDSISGCSWSPMNDNLARVLDTNPPVPPKGTMNNRNATAEAEKSPDTPPKDEVPNEAEGLQGHSHHTSHSLYNKWMKATGLRRRASAKPLLMPTTIREESETPAKDSKRLDRPAMGQNDALPQISVDLPLPVQSSSSFERALDAVISKLDAMEERRCYERKMDLRAARQALNKSEFPVQEASKLVTLKPTVSVSESPRSQASLETIPSPEVAIEYSDSGINDRDILLGLKMAICAACDENLDAWICNKTGLRLRRFLADLKAFDSISQDRKQAQQLPMSRRIRRNGEGKQRPQGQQRRKGTPKNWTPCFGGDGQGSLASIGKDMPRDLIAR